MISYFRHCKHCGLSIFQNDFSIIDFFCNRCWVELEKFKTPDHFVVYKTEKVLVRPLFLWREKDSVVGSLIHGLKGGTPESVLQKLSLEIGNRYFTKENSVFAPVPTSKVGEIDHAFKMANFISKTQKMPLWDGLIWKNKSQNQKFLNKTERFVSEMETVKSLSRKHKIILVDDLVTSGATALAARKAIKSLNQIEVWALACRI